MILEEEIRRYCIENDLFSCGTNTQYEKMFGMVSNAQVTNHDIAVAIWICSDTDKKVVDIEKDINEIRG